MRLTLPTRSCQRLFNRPPQLTQSARQHGVRHIEFARPFTYCQSLATHFNYAVAAFIVCLFGSSGPSAIFRGIAKVVVDTLNRMICSWTRPHVLKKILEAVQPVPAHRNPSRPIILVGRCVRISTSSLNARPVSILSHSSQTVRTVSIAHHLVMEASATGSTPTNQGRARNGSMSATVALAKPGCLLESVRSDKAKNEQSAKLLPGQVLHLFLGYRQYCRQIIRGNCKRRELRGMILHVISSFQLLTMPPNGSNRCGGILIGVVTTYPAQGGLSGSLHIIAQACGLLRINSLTTGGPTA